MTTPALLKTLLLGALAIASSFTHAAPLSNGRFDQGLSAWSTAGDVSVHTQASAPADLPLDAGSWALLGTGSLSFPDDAPAAPGQFNLSGTNVVPALGDLEASLGLAADALMDSDANRVALEGSALWQHFDVRQGDTLSFDWRLFSRGLPGPGDEADTAWLVWQLGGSTQWVPLTRTDDSTLTSAGGGWWSSARQGHSLLAAHSGMATLGLIMADVNSYDTTSVLAIQQVVLTSAVPEPGSVELILAGLLMLVFMSVRLHRRHRE
ncbi:MAG TPA: hypothetical protein VFW84_00925 [Aquabacterium sp.]|uniref:hypothetical protein n=1 Tax=Aquabacterium sp. TaxID=1872578 RepID=UPI002E3229EA|nr:hypothetical protein [Aquabacterium sp.]HEX5371274.1 hypothetical protein [Aquabacterium sp.]